MDVYVLTQWWAYDSTDLEDVYLSLEAAKKDFKKRKDYPGEWVQNVLLPDIWNLLTGSEDDLSNHGFTITKMRVKE